MKARPSRLPVCAGSNGVTVRSAHTISLARVSTTASELSHVYPLGSRVNARGHLEVGGCDAVQLAHRFGTPVYVVAEDDLRARARAFVDALAARHADFDVLFASKAFPCTAVYRVLAEEGLACDVASGGELALALNAGFDAARTYLHGNAKSETELREALGAGVGHIVLDSMHEIERLARVAAELDAHQDVLIRVTPGVAGDTHAAISTGQADSKFGFSIDQARDAIAALAGHERLTLVGLHVHIGSQLLELEPFRAAVQAIATTRRLPRLQPRRGSRRRLHVRPASAVAAGLRRRDRRCRARRTGGGQAAVDRARPGTGGQLGDHPLHR